MVCVTEKTHNKQHLLLGSRATCKVQHVGIAFSTLLTLCLFVYGKAQLNYFRSPDDVKHNMILLHASTTPRYT